MSCSRLFTPSATLTWVNPTYARGHTKEKQHEDQEGKIAATRAEDKNRRESGKRGGLRQGRKLEGKRRRPEQIGSALLQALHLPRGLLTCSSRFDQHMQLLCNKKDEKRDGYGMHERAALVSRKHIATTVVLTVPRLFNVFAVVCAQVLRFSETQAGDWH